MPYMKPATPADVGNVKQAIECLRSARDLMKIANCPQTVRRIRLALTSAGGALRHVEHRQRRTEAGNLRERWSARQEVKP